MVQETNIQKSHPVYEDIKNLRVYGLPLGQAILGFSRPSPDRQTQDSLKRAEKITENSGLLVFDAHRSEWDIMVVAAQLGHHLPVEYMTGFIAAKWSRPDNLIGSAFNRAVNSKQHLSLIEVMREEDAPHVSGEKYSNRFSANADSIDSMRQSLTGVRRIGVIAPYGSRKKFLQPEKIRRGAVELAREFPSICSLAVFRPAQPGYVICLSPPLSFNPEDSDQKIREALQEQFAALARDNKA